MKGKELQRTRRVAPRHARVKVVRVETQRLGFFGRVVVSIICVLALGAAFFFSVVIFSVVIVIGILGLLYALWVSRNAETGEDRVIDGERVVDEESQDEVHEHLSHRD